MTPRAKRSGASLFAVPAFTHATYFAPRRPLFRQTDRASTRAFSAL